MMAVVCGNRRDEMVMVAKKQTKVDDVTVLIKLHFGMALWQWDLSLLEKKNFLREKKQKNETKLGINFIYNFLRII